MKVPRPPCNRWPRNPNDLTRVVTPGCHKFSKALVAGCVEVALGTPCSCRTKCWDMLRLIGLSGMQGKHAGERRPGPVFGAGDTVLMPMHVRAAQQGFPVAQECC
jgi:hypothetical protein